ncbi:acyl-CoA dehydrogenase family protein [Pseudonocardia sp. WMMC193]|uniref:acyl-CoA dehydrogenase family protein n=1 Tax=Pseudonocardia sp. WMMC193 TaxID=2911965 RepID=UPI001F313E74|nr:acyl-CoA dehydrogenase family protein [Pseudonocardia sp. WMMC193]MCF7549416.1 acyl-CoA/acyl-ACP dehydrogenase [Pseudonocardia sp. WMMC193]
MDAEQRGPEFGWTDEHRALRATVRDLLAARAPVARARELAEAGERHDPALWTALAADVGLQGLALPERYGGSGGTLVDLAIVVEEMGRVLFGGPFLSTVALAAPVVLASGDERACAAFLPRVADGTLTAALAVEAWAEDEITVTADAAGALTGTVPVVLDGADADLLVVAACGPDGVAPYLVEAGAVRTPLSTMDLTRRAARVTFDATPGTLLGDPGRGWAVLQAARSVSSALVAAEQVGGMAAATELTAEYARTRRQFGRLIGSFQGVKHRLADMTVRSELARSAAYWAAWQRVGSDALAHGAAVARSYCGDAFLQTGLDTIQLHGGIGFTWEHDAHLYLRRARADRGLLGTPAQARSELAARLAPRTTTEGVPA